MLASGLLVWFAPRPAGVEPASWTLLAIFVATIIGSIVQPMTGQRDGAARRHRGGGLRRAQGRRRACRILRQVVWLVLAAFFLSRAMIKTGLGQRIALWFVRLIGRRTLGIGYALVITDFLLASVIPSTGARSGGIILPIARSVSETYDSRPDDGTAGRMGTFLMNLLYQCEVIICATFLTGQASNVIIKDFVQKGSGIELTYSAWFVNAIVPSLVSLTVIPLLIYRFYPPEIKETPNVIEFARGELAKLGDIKRGEVFLFLVFLLIVALWVTSSLHASTRP